LKIYFPKHKEHIDYPKVTEGKKGKGSVELGEFEFDPQAMEILAKGEKNFTNGDCKAALESYEKAIFISKDFYPAYLSAGDCNLLLGNPEKALSLYEAARQLNPFDYRVHFFIASAYTKLSRFDEAKKSYIRALTLRPHYGMTMLALRGAADSLNVEIHDERLEPKALAVKKEDGIYIYITDEDKGIWTAYAFAKALWLGEPTYRKKYLGTEESEWTTKEEMQSIFTMLDLYENMLASGTVKKIPRFERIKSIIQDGYFGSFILYEIGPNLGDDIMLMLNEETRQEVERYVSKYVLVEK
jgi:tetratricopeptide (TPR) repeat protein